MKKVIFEDLHKLDVIFSYICSFDDATSIKGKLRRNEIAPREISIGDKIEDFMSLGGFQISADCQSERSDKISEKYFSRSLFKNRHQCQRTIIAFQLNFGKKRMRFCLQCSPNMKNNC